MKIKKWGNFTDLVYVRIFLRNTLDVLGGRGLIDSLRNIKYFFKTVSLISSLQYHLNVRLERYAEDSTEMHYIDMFGEEKWERIKKIRRDGSYSSVHDFSNQIKKIQEERV